MILLSVDNSLLADIESARYSFESCDSHDINRLVTLGYKVGHAYLEAAFRMPPDSFERRTFLDAGNYWLSAKYPLSRNHLGVWRG